MPNKRTLKGIRIDLGLSQKEMGSKLGLSESAYRKKESYETRLLAEELLKIADISGLEPREIRVA